MRTVWFLGLSTAALFVGIAVYLLPLTPSVVGLQFTFSEPAFLAVLQNWGSDGIARFRAHFVADYALLVCYGAFGFVFARRTGVLSECSPMWRGALTWALPLAALADAIENALHLYLSSGAPHVETALYPAAGGAATLKWLLIGVFVVGVARNLGKRTGKHLAGS
ncbi:MAG: hypothetical protein M9884_02845 [Rhodocyclaceae bacterium]|jgi:hypothetical protein|nr:hypothetical protein [Rhodocyclaceae bacterium]MCO5096397.1 hypothetical protein [Rhodocyclaceae bacterium]